MKKIRKLSAIFLSFCIICSAFFVMTVSGNQTVNAANDSTDNVVLQQGFEDGAWVYAEKTITAVGDLMVLYMQPSAYTNLAGTTVYIDDVTVTETASNTQVLNQTFDTDTARDTTFYVSGPQIAANGIAPASGVAGDPRKTCLVTGEGVGHNGSSGVMQLGYASDPDSSTKYKVPCFRVRNSKSYNNRDTGLGFKFKANTEYKISFYYKAVGVKTSFDLYVTETSADLATGTNLGNSASGGYKNRQLLTKVTSNTAEGWVYAESTFTAKGGGNNYMILYMQPSSYTNLAGTTVYIDDIVIKEKSSGTVALNLPFEAIGAGKYDTVYYGTGPNIYKNGIAPASNIAGDPRKTCLVTGGGHNGSSGAMQLGYTSNPDSNTNLRLPSFRLRNASSYNNRYPDVVCILKSSIEYTISFYYRAVGVNTSFKLYVSEADNDLNSTSLGNSASNGYKNRHEVVNVTASTVEEKNASFYNSVNYHFGVAPEVSSNIPNDPRKVSLASGTGVGNNSNSALQLGYTANPDNTNNGGLPIVKVRNSKDYNSKNTYQAFRFKTGKTYDISFYYKAVGVNAPLGLYVSEYNESLSGYRAGFSTSTVAKKAQKINDISASTTGWVKVETIYTPVDGHDMVLFMKPTDYTNLAGTMVYIDDVVVREVSITKPEAPATPKVQTYSETSVTLEVVDGCEYSIDGAIWQNSNVFDNLTPWGTYTFYQRVKATSTSLASDSAMLEDYILVFHGDLDKSKKIDSVDLVILRKVLLGVDVEYEQAAANVNKDNKIDLKDLVALKKKCYQVISQ